MPAFRGVSVCACCRCWWAPSPQMAPSMLPGMPSGTGVCVRVHCPHADGCICGVKDRRSKTQGAVARPNSITRHRTA